MDLGKYLIRFYKNNIIINYQNINLILINEKKFKKIGFM